MKTKEQKLESIRRKVLTTIHGCEDYGKALEKELGFGCMVSNWEGDHRIISDSLMIDDWGKVSSLENGDYEKQYSQVQGLPVTLPRLLAVIEKMSEHGVYEIRLINGGGWFLKEEFGKDEMRDLDIFWQLLRPDGSEMPLEEQSEECISAIYNLICKDE